MLKLVKEMRSFLGFCTYYRRIVQGFANITAPLHKLTHKGALFHWDESCQTAFKQLKEALVGAPVLPYPDPSSPYILACDTSTEGIGTVLSQVQEGQERVVICYSQKFSRPERNYCVAHKELLAVVKTVDHFHPYLYRAKFTVPTDHATLCWLKMLKNRKGQMVNWLGRLEQYHYYVEHHPGQVHGNVDSLSQPPASVCTQMSPLQL